MPSLRWLTKRKREARHFRLAPAPFWAMRPHIRAVCPVRKMEAQRSRLTSASISSCRGRTSLMTVFQMAGTRSVIELCARTSRNAAILYSLSLRRCNQDTMRPRVRIHSTLLCCARSPYVLYVSLPRLAAHSACALWALRPPA